MIYVVIAHDQTDYRLVRAYSTLEKAEKCKEMLKELLWRKITIDKIKVDEK
jgi:hypothetical protein